MLNLPNVNLGLGKVSFLGHVKSKDGVSTDPNPTKIGAIIERQRPKNVLEMTSFLGLVGYYRVESRKAFPLTRLTHKNVKFEQDDNYEKSFQELKTILTTAPIMSLYDNGGFVILSNASNKWLDCVLQHDKVIAY